MTVHFPQPLACSVFRLVAERRSFMEVHYWLEKLGGARWVPRPGHVKQDPAATATFCAAPLTGKMEMQSRRGVD